MERAKTLSTIMQVGVNRYMKYKTLYEMRCYHDDKNYHVILVCLSMHKSTYRLQSTILHNTSHKIL